MLPEDGYIDQEGGVMACISGSASGAVSSPVSMGSDEWEFVEISYDDEPVVFGGEETTFSGEEVTW